MSASFYSPPSFYFRLSIAGVDQNDAVSFQEVSGLSTAEDPDINWRGDDNRFTFQVPKVASNQNLVCKRGILHESSSFATWCIGPVQQSLAGEITAKRLELSLLDSNDQASMIWQFENAYPVQISLGSIRPDNDSVVVESLEFAYSTMTVQQGK